MCFSYIIKKTVENIISKKDYAVNEMFLIKVAAAE
jgi:hypothetical protein